MESILYNTTDKEVTVILGYGIGNHLSLEFLKGILADIKKVFPKISDENLEKLKFSEVAQASRSHRYMWYTRFHYPLYIPKTKKDSYYDLGNGEKAYLVYPHVKDQIHKGSPAETAAQICSRMTHD